LNAPSPRRVDAITLDDIARDLTWFDSLSPEAQDDFYLQVAKLEVVLRVKREKRRQAPPSIGGSDSDSLGFVTK
jgi:hypothetical protein